MSMVDISLAKASTTRLLELDRSILAVVSSYSSGSTPGGGGTGRLLLWRPGRLGNARVASYASFLKLNPEHLRQLSPVQELRSSYFLVEKHRPPAAAYGNYSFHSSEREEESESGCLMEVRGEEEEVLTWHGGGAAGSRLLHRTKKVQVEQRRASAGCRSRTRRTRGTGRTNRETAETCTHQRVGHVRTTGGRIHRSWTPELLQGGGAAPPITPALSFLWILPDC